MSKLNVVRPDPCLFPLWSGLIFVLLLTMIFQTAAEGQKIGSLFSLVENYKILANYSQPLKQSTTDEIVGFVAALTKVTGLPLCPLSSYFFSVKL